MFKFYKSETDLGKLASPIQYKIICDWLRTIKNTSDRLERSNKIILVDIAKLYDLLLKDDSPPEDIENYDSSPDTEPVH